MRRFRDIAGLVIVQDPNASRLRTIDWGSSDLPAADRWLPSGVTIVSATFDVDDATLDSSGYDENTTTMRISGVTRTFAEGGHKIRTRIVASNGEIQDQTFTLVAGEE